MTGSSHHGGNLIRIPFSRLLGTLIKRRQFRAAYGNMESHTSLDRFRAYCKWEIPAYLFSRSIMTTACQCAFLVAFGWTLTAHAAETVRIDATSGTPRIIVDGKPVRARLLGIPGTKPLPVSAAGGPVTFEFTPAEDEPQRTTMHFRFGQTPGTVDLDDIRVEEPYHRARRFAAVPFESGSSDFTSRWNVWPIGETNTVGRVEVRPGVGRAGSGGLHVTLKAPPGGQWPDFHIHSNANLALHKDHHCRVSLGPMPARDLTSASTGREIPMCFSADRPTGTSGKSRWRRRRGPLVSFPVDLPWPRPGEKTDWSHVDSVPGSLGCKSQRPVDSPDRHGSTGVVAEGSSG